MAERPRRFFGSVRQVRDLDGAMGVCAFNTKLAAGGADAAFLPMTTAIGPLGFICCNLQRLKVGRLFLRQAYPLGYMLIPL